MGRSFTSTNYYARIIMSTAAAAAPKAKKAAKPKAPAAHPPYAAMIKAAVKALADKKGSSRQAILKYICANYKVDAAKAPGRVRLALKKWLHPRLLCQLLLLERRELDPSSLLPRNQRPRSLLLKNQRPRNLLPRNQRPRSQLPRNQRRLPKSLLLRNQQLRNLLPRSQQLRSPPRKLDQRRSKLASFQNRNMCIRRPFSRPVYIYLKSTKYDVNFIVHYILY